MSLQIKETEIPEVLVVEPRVFEDSRGYFYESFNSDVFRAVTGVSVSFVQDNHSKSVIGVVRGLHYQIEQPQGKLVRVVEGRIFDVAVDIRRGSPSFGKWTGVELSADNRRQIWIPAGFAHGFAVVSDSAQVIYKTTDYYSPEHERCIRWDDPDIGIEWPDAEQPLLSAKDKSAKSLVEAELPVYSK